MLNQVVLVGRLTKDPVGELNRPCKEVNLAIPRAYKNNEGEYETDFINCELWNNSIGESCSEYCKKGDIIGVKGRLESREGKIIMVAEKITFLSSKREGE